MAVAVKTTPGVYIQELDAFPPSVVGVPTAVPVFIGFTKKAEISGKPVFLKPIKIGSMVDFESIFGDNYEGENPFKQVTNADEVAKGKYDFSVESWNQMTILSPLNVPAWDNPTPKYYHINLPTVSSSSTQLLSFNLFYSMRLFYANGGGTCYVISVGAYKDQTDGVTLAPLLEGLAAAKEQAGPTMLVIPDATLLPPDANSTPTQSSAFQTIVRDMLAQCYELQDRVAVLDVYAANLIGKKVGSDVVTIDQVVDQFRLDVDGNFLNYGMAYFPFPVTSVVSTSDFDYTSLTPIEDSTAAVDLKQILTWQNVTTYGVDQADGTRILTPRGELIQAKIDSMEFVSKNGTPLDIGALNQDLTAALPLLNDMFKVLATKNSILPPSAAMAGVVTFVDNNQGVWNAPANITMNQVTQTTYKLNNQEQGDLNMPIDGKAINALREFPDRGTVVWGARTLDGNSNDWRYVQVRRTLIYIEQSIKAALNKFVFAANDANTWVKVTAMVSTFLQGLWSQGGLMGAKASEAFTVQCGLGSTMTSQDILSGYMIVQITVQLIRPAEFIVLTFKQQMAG